MRITHQQMTQLIDAITPFVGNHTAELRLYGSRVRDDRKGGDIDLLLLVEGTPLADLINEKKHHLIAHIKKQLGDQKIDLLITDCMDSQKVAFLNMILPESVCLKQWGHPISRC